MSSTHAYPNPVCSCSSPVVLAWQFQLFLMWNHMITIEYFLPKWIHNEQTRQYSYVVNLSLLRAHNVRRAKKTAVNNMSKCKKSIFVRNVFMEMCLWLLSSSPPRVITTCHLIIHAWIDLYYNRFFSSVFLQPSVNFAISLKKSEYYWQVVA